MPPAGKKDGSIILYDVKSKNKEKCLQTLMKIACKKYFSNSKDITKLILTNTEKTNNQLAAHYGDGYRHIYETTENVVLYDPRDFLEAVQDAKPGNANWLEALEVALCCLQENFECITGIITYQLIFITDLDSSLKDISQLETVIEKINNIEAYLYIIGPEIGIPCTIKSAEDIKKWMNEFEGPNTKNMEIAKKIINKTENSVICDWKMGNQLVFSYKKWAGTQPWNVPLAIGSQLAIPAQSMRVLKKFVDCRLVLKREQTEWKWIDSVDETITVDFSDVISGISRHGKFIKIEPETNQMFKGNDSRSFQILCFTDSSNISEYLMMGDGSYYVLPPKDGKTASFHCLIDCLLEQRKYVVARRVYNNRFNPKFVVLVPKQDPKCFILAELPYADDVIVDFTEKSQHLFNGKEERVDEIYEFLDDLNGKNVLNVTMMQDINVAKIVNKVADKSLGKYLHLDEIDLDFFNLKVDEKIENNLKKVWPELEINTSKRENENNNEIDFNSDVEFDWG